MLSICTITYNAKCLRIISSKAICEELLTNFTYDRLGLRKKIEGNDKIDSQIAYPSPFLFCFFSRGCRSGKQKTKVGLTSPFTAVTCFFLLFFFAGGTRILRSGKTKGDHPGGTHSSNGEPGFRRGISSPEVGWGSQGADKVSKAGWNVYWHQ